MNLYKRVFPKWSYTEDVATPTGWHLKTDHDEHNMD